MADKKIGVGLVGAGRIGRIHAANICAHDELDLLRVSDIDEHSAMQVVRNTGATLSTFEEIVQDSDIGAVVVASNTFSHAGLVKRAALNGKAVFCEKPLDLSLQTTDQCLRVVEKTRTPLVVGFNRRYDPQFQELKHRLNSGEIGEVESVHITSRDPSPPPAKYVQSSGGIFRDMTIHDFDMARWLLGEEPVAIFAMASVLVDSDIGRHGDFDSAVVSMRTQSGKLCQINNSRRAVYGYDQRVEVLGSDGMLQVGNIFDSTVVSANRNGFATSRVQDFFVERYSVSFAAEMDHFVAVIRRRDKILTSGRDGRQALLLAEKAMESIEIHGEVEVFG